MFLHAVLMELSADADAAFHARVARHCEAVRASCAGVVSYGYGPNQASRSAGLGWAVVGCFTDAAAHDAYQVSAAHVAMKADMAPVIVRLVVLDTDV